MILTQEQASSLTVDDWRELERRALVDNGRRQDLEPVGPIRLEGFSGAQYRGHWSTIGDVCG